jgi:signal transduction histidine kinase
VINVPAVETTAWNRLRGVDREIWDALLALVAVALSVIGFLIEQRGPGHRDGDDDGPTIGHGLIGMHERTQLFGGEFEAGARPGGGVRVRARLSTRSENAR